MFGSDFPWFDPALAIERLLRLDFTQPEKRQLLAENARRIYKL
jgi:predicted TIM-barrel fold metal-dependent hydrolase